MTPFETLAAPDRQGTAPRLADLSRGALALVLAARAWTAGEAIGPASPCALLRAAGIAPAGFPALAGLLGLLGACPSGPCFGSFDDDALSPGEAGFVAALAALEAGEPWRAQRIVAGWAAPAAAPRVVALMASLARGVRSAGLSVSEAVPRRLLH